MPRSVQQPRHLRVERMSHRERRYPASSVIHPGAVIFLAKAKPRAVFWLQDVQLEAKSIRLARWRERGPDRRHESGERENGDGVPGKPHYAPRSERNPHGKV
jgi:hypothetical protein